ncbi:MAG: hypothetical protein BGO51_15425 [Rhodospirillales bacterium 69-11]|nr:MAG: hypothetical protein BGO51_15425 [Rhodospirillales bacterium 69-11]
MPSHAGLLTACLIAGLGLGTPAKAQTVPSGVVSDPIYSVTAGARGEDDASIAAATAQAAAPIRIDIAGAVTDPSRTFFYLVNAQSFGGVGGAGDGGTSAGPGGAGGAITLTNSGNVFSDASGPGAELIWLTSYGGKGGNSNLQSDSTGLKPPGTGGQGGAITLTQTGSVTGIDRVAALDLLSQGGDSGRGGRTASLLQSRPKGSVAGDGGAITITIADQALVSNSRTLSDTAPAFGIRAVSQGGQGDAGSTVGDFFSSMAGDGSNGGAGGPVTIRLDGNVQAAGNSVTGVYAVSRGGPGGSGGRDNSWLDAFPGASGNGGAAGPVVMRIGPGGSVTTSGADSPAVFLEARGGDGAAGGIGGGSLIYTGRVGGTGGSAQTTAEPSIRFENAGVVSTTGDRSSAVLLVSVGGNGGNGSPNGSATGGNGGAGGDVSGTNTGRLQTSGSGSFGLYGLSAGGIGGNGTDNKGNILNLGGGNGGASGAAGDVRLVNSGSITTTGDNASAMVGQSIGGGWIKDAYRLPGGVQLGGSSSAAGADTFALFGGRAGAGGAGGAAGAVELTNNGQITTAGQGAFGILAQSLGGGGGNGGSAKVIGPGFAVALGGDGGVGGNGGAVTLRGGARDGRITTVGDGATALFAQSVGGGGGIAGKADATSASIALGWSLALGGSGGGGGNGGRIDLTNTSALATSGSNAAGIVAQSVGGGGGDAGSASASTTVFGGGEIPAIAATATIGGSGGSGGAGGSISVTNAASIITAGATSSGIKALSVGGGGGDGAAANSTSNLLGLTTNLGTAIALGGSGGGGGKGGDITIGNTGAIATAGDFSYGIGATSVGGGGGEGSTGAASTAVGIKGQDALNLGLKFLPMAKAVTVDFALGGSGGGGGKGGNVTVTNGASLSTAGGNAYGVLAQSIGGGGGNAGGYSGGGSGKLSAKVTVGGSGRAGGNGGDVTVTNGGTIQTLRDGSTAILAQSVGGGGGNGGSLAQSPPQDTSGVVIFLKTVYGAIASNPVVKALDTVGSIDKEWKQTIEAGKGKFADKALQLLKTFDDKLLGSSAQKLANDLKYNGYFQKLVSDNVSKFQAWSKGVKASQPGFPEFQLTLGVGGTGGGGGTGGTVGVTNDSLIRTLGSQSFGIFAQSVGGGGGTGGGGSATGGTGATAAIGATGGDGGAGGSVTVTNTGRIETAGGLSYGVLAQSVGGGGGLGGVSQNKTGATDVNVSVTGVIGGNTGKRSPGGAVSVVNTGMINTNGVQAHGIVAQSIGGGGGIFQVAGPAAQTLSSAVPIVGDPALAQVLDRTLRFLDQVGVDLGATADAGGPVYSPTTSLTLTLGGSGGAGGDGTAVRVRSLGWVTTTGEGAIGILAQSIGGGGGLGGNATTTGALKAGLTLGGSGGTGGDGGAVTLVLGSQPVSTSGAAAHGVLLQSIGGGGGYAGAGTSVSLLSPNQYIGTGASSGDGGLVTFTSTDGDTRRNVTVTATGARANAVMIQSLGGGGGLVADPNGALVTATGNTRTNSRGKGGAIIVDAAGTLSATGVDASALVLQSGVQTTTGQLDRTRTGGDITVTWNGTLTGGTGTGAALVLDGGATNTVTLSGGPVSAASGQAIRASFGDDQVTSSGTLTGSVDLWGGRAGEVNTLVNTGVFNTGSRITLGPNGMFMNFGTLEIAGARTIGTTTVNGNFQHLAGGPWNVDVDYAQGIGDQMIATGGMTITGLVAPRLINLPASFLPGQLSVQIAGAPAIFATGAQVQNSIPLTYGLTTTAGLQQTANLAIVAANFAPPVLLAQSSTTTAMKDVAGYYQSIWQTGTLAEQQAQFVRLGGITDLASYQAALQDAAGTQYAVPALAQVQAGSAFQATLHSCPTFVDETTLLTEQSCAYLRNTDSVSHLADSEEGVGYRRTSAGIQIGGQGMVAPNWWIGAAIAPSQSWLTSNDGSSSGTGQTVDVGVVVKHQVAERWLFALSASYGHTDYDFSQTVQGPNGAERATAKQKLDRVTARFRTEYDIPLGTAYLRPLLDLDVNYVRVPAYSESGATLMDMHFGAASKVMFAASPMMEVGGRVNLQDAVLRIYGAAGFAWMPDSTWKQPTWFEGAPTTAGTFDTRFSTPNVLAKTSVGVDVLGWHHLDLKVQYDGAYSGGYASHAGTLRVAYPF